MGGGGKGRKVSCRENIPTTDRLAAIGRNRDEGVGKVESEWQREGDRYNLGLQLGRDFNVPQRVS